MKVNNFSNLGLNFRGYDAVPLKALYMQGVSDRGQLNILEEMAGVASKENIDLYVFNDENIIKPSEAKILPRYCSSRWAQDRKTFLETENGKKLIWASNDPSYNASVKKFFIDWKLEKDFMNPPGGNFFIGKNEKGEKWLLIGQDNVNLAKKNAFEVEYQKKTKAELAKIYDVCEENIFVIKQPNFHLDMSLRPVGYPYILVDDPKLSLKNLDSLEERFPNDKNIARMREFLNAKLNSASYANVDETIEALASFGFKPIRIAGSYSEEINFMNAIVHLKDDNKMTYITNSTKYSTEAEGALMNIFRGDLTDRFPQFKNIYFISGKEDLNARYKNDMMTNLGVRSGGIHCMTAEVPDFDRIG